MEKTGWKVLAIISMICLICSVIALFLIFHAGQQYELKRTTCAYDICGMDQQKHDSYFYAEMDDYCYCFLKGELDVVENVHDFLK
jgi:hypothetical protein